jgi:hypothetical protein
MVSHHPLSCAEGGCKIFEPRFYNLQYSKMHSLKSIANLDRDGPLGLDLVEEGGENPPGLGKLI